jgi:hypothetical protein
MSHYQDLFTVLSAEETLDLPFIVLVYVKQAHVLLISLLDYDDHVAVGYDICKVGLNARPYLENMFNYRLRGS